MRYKKLCCLFIILSLLFIIVALILYNDMSFPLIGSAIILLGIAFKIWLSSQNFK